MSPAEKEVYVRKVSLQKDIQKSELHNIVISKLIDAHIFVTGKDHLGQATISLVHETLIVHWNVIKLWIQEQRDFLMSNAYYEQRTQHWIKGGKSAKDLIQVRTALLNVEYFIYKYSKFASKDTIEFLSTSLKADRRQGWLWQCIIAVLGLFFFAILIFNLVGQQYNESVVKYLGDISSTSIIEIVLSFFPLYTILLYNLILKLITKLGFKIVR